MEPLEIILTYFASFSRCDASIINQSSIIRYVYFILTHWHRFVFSQILCRNGR